MESIDRLVRLALLSWAYWTGHSTVVREVREREEGFADELPPGLYDRLLQLAAGLYFPVSPDAWCKTDLFSEPWNDNIYSVLSKGLGCTPKPFWPDERPFAVVLSHDVDRIQGTYQTAMAAFRMRALLKAICLLIRGLPLFPYRSETDPCRNLGRLLVQERRWDIQSVMFLLKERRRVKELLRFRPQHFFGIYDPRDIQEEIQRMVEQGHEIGLHVSMDGFHSQEALSSEKAYIESLWHKRIAGARTHYLLFSEKTPELLMRAGFSYDASMGFNFHNGFRCGTAFPFVLWEEDSRILWELPLHLMDTALLWQVRSVEDLSHMEQIITPIFTQVKEKGGLLMVNWHQRHFNRALNQTLYDMLGELVLTSRRAGAWMTTPEALMAWWTHERPHDTYNSTAS